MMLYYKDDSEASLLLYMHCKFSPYYSNSIKTECDKL